MVMTEAILLSSAIGMWQKMRCPVAAVCQGGQTFGLKFQTGPKDAKGLR